MKKSLLSVGSICAMAVALSYSAPARADMDYSSLQELFGEPVTVGATGTPQKASEVAANMTIITADQIRQSGYRDIPEILGAYVPGIDVLRTSNEGYDVGVRGDQQVFQPRLLVLVDGRQVFIDDYSRTIWNNIPVNLDDIRQIEVVKGPASALFGSNAASGVINIITYSPQYDKNNVASVTVGTQETLEGNATVTKNGEWGGTKFSAGGLDANEFNTEKAGDDITINPYHRYVTNSSVVKLTPDLTASGEFTYSESRQSTALPSLYALTGEKTTTYSARGGLGYQTNLGLITTDTYLNHSFDSVVDFQSPVPDGITTDLLVNDIDDQFKIGTDNTFRVGVEYRHKDFRLTTAADFAHDAPSTSEDGLAASGTWLWNITDKLSWTNAARVDHLGMQQTGLLPSPSLFTNADYSHDINTWSGNSGLVYKLTDMDTLHASYGRGVQMPSLIQSGIDAVDAYGPYSLAYEGNPELKPTITQNYEIGYDRKVPEAYSTAKISAFIQNIQDAVGVVSKGYTTIHGSGVILVEGENVGNSDSYGGELELLGTYNGFRWDGSYSLARVTDSDGVLAGIGYQGSSPEHHFRLNGGYTYKQWEFDANSQIMSSTNMLRDTTGVAAVATPISGYTTLGGRIGYNITDAYTVSVSGTNINRQYLTTSPFPAVERQAFVTLTGKF